MKGVCISLFTDSETSIITSKNTRLNTLHFVISNDVDVALQLRETMTTCNQNISLVHVPGHQDKNKKFHELDTPAQLNVLMDSLSKKMVLDTINNPNCIIPTPAQKMYVHSSKPIAHNLTNVLVEREMQHDIKEYYEKHHNIRPKVLHDID